MSSRATVAALILALLSLANAANTPEPMDGYSPAHAATERDWETKFRNLPDPAVLRDSMEHLSARPHNVGSPYDKANAEWMLAKFKEFGFDAHIETFDVLISDSEGAGCRIARANALCRQAARTSSEH